MGEVYRARDTRLDRAVALKLLPAAIQHDAQRRTLLRREARAVAALDHPTSAPSTTSAATGTSSSW
jgi:serine/threonine protein kinase